MATKDKKIPKEYRSIYSLGKKLGEAVRHQIMHADNVKERNELAKVNPQWLEKGMELSEIHTPITCTLLHGMSDSTGVPYEKIFAGWYEELSYIKTPDKSKLKDRGCTDLVVKDRHLIIAHTNDESPGSKSTLLRLAADGFPEIIAVFSGASPSVACNSAGMVFSGNQIDANDTKPGIPRMLLYMEACFSESIDDAKQILLNSNRSSSFNNILANSDGDVVSIEASADLHKEVPVESGAMVHSNHFIWLADREGRVGKPLTGSGKRLSRAVNEIGVLEDKSDLRDVIKILRSHGKGGLCRHNDVETDTCFSTVFLPEHGIMLYGKGFPCQTKYKAYRFCDKKK